MIKQQLILTVLLINVTTLAQSREKRERMLLRDILVMVMINMKLRQAVLMELKLYMDMSAVRAAEAVLIMLSMRRDKRVAGMAAMVEPARVKAEVLRKTPLQTVQTL